MDNALNSASPAAATPASPNPHVLWRQLLGLAVWVAAPYLFVGGLRGFAVGTLLAGLTFADAWISGIYKHPGKRAFLNMSPMGWGIVMAMVLIVGYPAYIVSRNRLRTVPGTNILYWCVVGLGGLVLALGVLTTIAHLMLGPS